MKRSLGDPCPGTRNFLRTPALAALAALVLCSTASAIERTYQYFRFTPTAPGAGNLIQLSEFRFFNGATPIPMNTALVENINGAAQSPGNESPPNIVDGNTGTKWLNYNNSGTAGLIFDFGAPVTVDRYDFATANDALGRTPTSWTLEGSDNKIDWNLIDQVSNNPIPGTLFTFIPQIELQPVILQSFTTNNTIVLNGTFIDLQWSTVLATDVSLEPGGFTGLPESGFETVEPPDDSDTTYTLTASNVDGSRSADLIVRTVAGGTSNFRYVRFTPTKLRNDAAANSIQLSELRFLDGLTVLTPVVVTNPGGVNPASGAEGPGNLNDDNTGTKWLDFNKQGLVYDFGVPVDFDGYYFATANDSPARDPIRWTIEGSNDEVAWTLVDNVTAFDFNMPVARQTFSQDIPMPGGSITPFASLVGDAPFLISGEPLVLTWNTLAAATVEIDNGVGVVGASGSVEVNPVADTTYTVTATSAGGVESTSTFDVVIVNPAVTTIAYPNFDAAGDELSLLGAATILNDFVNIPAPGDANRLRLNSDNPGQTGTAWFRKRIDTSAGFSTTFGAQFITLNATGAGADGLAFIIQNDPLGTAKTPLAGAEDGVAQNALNIKFDSWQNEGDLSAAVIQVRDGTTVLEEVDLNTVSSVVPLPGFDPADLTMNSGDTPPYEIRVDYVPGDLDVYFNNVLVIDSVDVDLAAIGAVDGSGTGYVGFAARSGGQFEAHDITSWFLTEGAPPPPPAAPGAFVIKSFSFNFETDQMQITWGSNELKSYKITTSTDGIDWTEELATGIPGAAGMAETSAPVPFTHDPTRLFRVEEE